jgi:hypothetical protein
MKRKLFGFILLSSIALLSFVVAPKQAPNCEIMKQGTFTYGKKKNQVVVKIKEFTHTEYHDGGKYYMVSKIAWVDDCSYTATLVESTVPNIGVKPGAKLLVQIGKIRNNKVRYTATLGNRSWKGKYTKISNEIN